MIRMLPRDFVLGATISAYQTEGAVDAAGRIPCAWDRWYARPDSTFDAREASGFYTSYREDIARCRAFNIRALGISLAWTRIIRDEQGTVNEEGVQFYQDVIQCCRENGIEPYVALYHFDTPLFLFDRGEWLAPETAEQFLHYAQVCFERFGGMVRYWITMKDPVSLVMNEYVAGQFPPAEHFAAGKAVLALHRMLTAHSRAVVRYKELGLPGKIGIVHRAESVYPLAGSPGSERAASLDDTLTNRFLLDGVLAGGYSAETMAGIRAILSHEPESFDPAPDDLAALKKAAGQLDFLGVNYYASHFCEAWRDGAAQPADAGSYALKGISRRLGRADVPTTDWGWSIFPHGLYDMLLRIHEEYPHRPIYVTENGLGLHESLPASGPDGQRMIEDDDRIDYLRQHLSAVLDAMEEGVDVRGFFVWSMLDAMSWTGGYDKRYGLFYVDESGRRYPKKSAFWFRDLSARRIMLTVDALRASVLAH